MIITTMKTSMIDDNTIKADILIDTPYVDGSVAANARKKIGREIVINKKSRVTFVEEGMYFDVIW